MISFLTQPFSVQYSHTVMSVRIFIVQGYKTIFSKREETVVTIAASSHSLCRADVKLRHAKGQEKIAENTAWDCTHVRC